MLWTNRGLNSLLNRRCERRRCVHLGASRPSSAADNNGIDVAKGDVANRIGWIVLAPPSRRASRYPNPILCRVADIDIRGRLCRRCSDRHGGDRGSWEKRHES